MLRRAHCARGAAARAAHTALEAAVRGYNTKLVSDRENFGSAWPLQNAKAGDFDEHARAALEGGGT